MNILEQGQLLGDILAAYMSLDASRVVVTDQNFTPPKDQDLYIIIADEDSSVLGCKSKFDADTGTETQSIVHFTYFGVDVCSRSMAAKERHMEVLLAIESSLAQRKMEDNALKIFRAGHPVNLSSIEGSGTLQRYRVPVIISSVETKTVTPPVIDKFTTVHTEVEA